MSGFRPLGARLRVGALGAALTLFLLAPSASVFAQSADSQVDIKNIAYAPKEIHVAAGGTVTWTNDDALQHTVTADDGSFDSGLFDQGGTFTQEFDTPGTYAYYCTPHGGPGGVGMSAVVVVDG
jgi:plastocyanin